MAGRSFLGEKSHVESFTPLASLVKGSERHWGQALPEAYPTLTANLDRAIPDLDLPQKRKPGKDELFVSVIMIVDDDLDVLDLMSMMVQNAGYRTISASSAEEALLILESTSVDLILTDFKMPGMGGFGLITTLIGREQRLLDRIVVMTGDVSSLKEAPWPNGFRPRLLKKPFGVQDLLCMIHALLERGCHERP